MKPRTRQVFNHLETAFREGRNDGWVCGRTLTHPKVGGWRFGARLAEIRAAGVRVEKRVCNCDERCRYARLRARDAGNRPAVTWAYRIESMPVEVHADA